MHCNGCTSTIPVPKLLVRAALPYFNEVQIFQKLDYLSGFEGGYMTHSSLNNYLLSANKFCFHCRQSVLQQH